MQEDRRRGYVQQIVLFAACALWAGCGTTPEAVDGGAPGDAAGARDASAIPGVDAGGAPTGGDSGASGDRDSGPATPTCPPSAMAGGPALWANLEACGWPGPGNTGPTSSDLTPQGSEVITADDTVFENALVTGCIVVQANNVTIRNVRVDFDPSDSNCTSRAGWAAINVTSGSSASITDTEVDGNGMVHIGIRNAGQGLDVLRVHVHDVEDEVYANLLAADRAAHPTAGSNTTITDSYFHDFVPRAFNNPSVDDSARANGHIDGMQTDGGAIHTQLIHNTFDMGYGEYTPIPGQMDGAIDSATAFWNGGDRTLDDVLVTRNLFAAAAGFIHYAYDRTGMVGGTCGATSDAAPDDCGSVTNIRFIDNRYSTIYDECIGGYGIWFPRGTPTGGWDASGNERSGNLVVENGQSVDTNFTPLRADGTECGH